MTALLERVDERTGVRVYLDSALEGEAGVRHGFSTRAGGVSAAPYASLNLGPRSGDEASRVRENRRRFLGALGLESLAVFAPRQRHSADVDVFAAGDPPPPGHVFPGDALVTDVRGIALMILAADCVPVLLADPERGVVAAVHAGWRGTAGGIAARAVDLMRSRFGCLPEHIRVVLGPAIGRCCYEVGPEVIAAVAASTLIAPADLYDRLPAGKGALDLVAANTAQLMLAGIAPDRITAAGLCTACRVDRFYSHRREGEPTGRGGAVIALP